jgi:hypothetical protein
MMSVCAARILGAVLASLGNGILSKKTGKMTTKEK